MSKASLSSGMAFHKSCKTVQFLWPEIQYNQQFTISNKTEHAVHSSGVNISTWISKLFPHSKKLFPNKSYDEILSFSLLILLLLKCGKMYTSFSRHTIFFLNLPPNFVIHSKTCWILHFSQNSLQIRQARYNDFQQGRVKIKICQN